MSASQYAAWSVTAGEQPTVAMWNQLGINDASFNTGVGFNDNIITWRHLSTDLIPSGVIQAFGGPTAPSSAWLICDGSAVSRAVFSSLFAAIGTNYGNGDGSTTFNLPNLSGRVPMGLDGSQAEFNALGETGGSKDMQAHSHGASSDVQGNHNHWVGNVGTSGGYGFLDSAHATSSGAAYSSTNGAHAHNIFINTTGTGANNLSPYVVVNYIIKT